jgi:RNA polymerase sigma factor (sigma-70 family)
MVKGHSVEASAFPASVGLARPRIAISVTLLRLRSDEQLVTLFRDGNEDAFRIIHDRYRTRLLAYARQMLAASGQDSEDALQEIFVRAYYGLRANQRDLALRPWLYRIAHNRCVDVLRHYQPIPVDPADALMPDQQDPAARAEQRDALRRLIADVRRLPEQQRSALLMRELSGMSYNDVASALGVSVPAVKSLLVRARVGLAAASEARNTACAEIREDLIVAHDRGVRASGLARRHLHECQGCREFRSDVRGVSRQLAALTPTLGPVGVIANLLGFGGGGAAAGTSMAGGSAAAAGGAATTGAASAGLLAGGAGHVVTLLAAAVVTAGGAVEIQRTFSAPVPHRVHHRVARPDNDRSVRATTAGQGTAGGTAPSTGASAFGVQAPAAPLTAASTGFATSTGAGSSYAAHALGHGSSSVPISQSLDPDQLLYNTNNPSGIPTGYGLPPTPGPGTPTGTPGTPTGTGTGTPAGTPTSTTPSPTPAGGNPTPTGTGSPTGTGTPGTTPAGTGTGTPAAGGTTGTGSTGTGSTGTGSTSTGSGSTGSTSTGSDGTAGTGSSGTSTQAGTSGTSTATGVAKTVGAGAASTGRVVSFVTAKRHIRRHGFALGTLLPR